MKISLIINHSIKQHYINKTRKVKKVSQIQMIKSKNRYKKKFFNNNQKIGSKERNVFS